MNIEPYADRHAIKTAAFAIEWKTPLTPNELAKISSLHPRVSAFLPRKTEQRMPFAFAMTNAPRAEGGMGGLVGVNFDALKPDGVASWSFLAQPGMIIVSCGDYSRWETVWDNVEMLLQKVIMEDFSERPIQAFGLQYLDEFKVNEKLEDLAVADILRKDSKFIPPNLFECRDLWHAYHGFFDRVNDDPKYKRLNIINIDLIDHSVAGLLLQIDTTHRALLDRPATFNELERSGKEKVFGQIMGQLHNHNKMVLCDLLTDAVCSRIGLGAEK
jgi:uncharacterized protein (TIGR04255 family)